MTFLPIVVRELSVASRRRAPFWTRLLFAGMAVLVAAFTLGYVGLIQPRPGLGEGVFRILSGLGLAFCAIAGVFLTADGLSEEKREGTLGLLFLTDLKGYDVVLGKLLATSLSAFYGVLALFPVLALTLVLGGVTAGEFWRVALAFLNTLFLSLAAGLFVSALSREAPRAVAATVVLLLGALASPPALDLALSLLSRRLPAFVLQFSPLWGWTQSFDLPYRSRPGDYWRCILAVQALSWSLLFLAAAVLPRVWQEGRPTGFARALHPRLTPARRGQRAEQRRRWLAPNPIHWLARRSPLPAPVHWLAFAALSGFVALLQSVAGTASLPILAVSGWLLPLALRAAVAMEAPRFFVEARQTGMLELLLCAPLEPGQLLGGQWLALIHRFWLPLLLVAGAQLSPAVFALMQHAGGPSFEWLLAGFGSGIWFVLQVVGLLLDLFATAWVGMLIGLSARRANRAAAYTFLWMVLIPSVIPCFPMFLVDIPLIFWARDRLHRGLRSLASQRPALLSPVPPAAPVARPVAPR